MNQDQCNGGIFDKIDRNSTFFSGNPPLVVAITLWQEFFWREQIMGDKNNYILQSNNYLEGTDHRRQE